MLLALLAGLCVFFIISRQFKKPTDEVKRAKWWLALAVGTVVSIVFMNPLSTVSNSDIVGKLVVRAFMILALCIPIIAIYFLYKHKLKKRSLSQSTINSTSNKPFVKTDSVLHTGENIDEPTDPVEDGIQEEKLSEQSPENKFLMISKICLSFLISMALLLLSFIASLLSLFIKHIRK